MDLTTLVGVTAALCTTASYFPQLKKCWETGSAEDLSLWMFVILATGIALWVVYGVLRSDAVIVLANSVSLCCLAGILYFKLRELWRGTTDRGSSGDAVPVRKASAQAQPARPPA